MKKGFVVSCCTKDSPYYFAEVTTFREIMQKVSCYKMLMLTYFLFLPSIQRTCMKDNQIHNVDTLYPIHNYVVTVRRFT